MNKPVVIGIESEQPSALRFAADAAVVRGVGLRVVHCFEPVLMGEIAGWPDESWAAAGQGILDDAKEIVLNSGMAPTADYALVNGSPDRTLRDEAKGASLVVVGTDSPAWIDRFFDGSTAAHLAKHSSAPVAVVPESRWPDALTGGVVVALDAKTGADGPLRFAFTEALRHGNVLHVLHVARSDTRFVDAPEIRAEVSEILAGWGQEFPDVKVTTRIVFDEADDGCVRATENAELLILGRHDSGTPLLQHRVLTQIVRRAHCPCVVVPDAWADTST